MTPTQLSTNDAGSGTSAVTGTVSPSSGSKLLLAVGLRDGANIPVGTITTTLSNVGTWSSVHAPQVTVGSARRQVAWYYADVTGSPGTGTVTYNSSLSITRILLALYEVTGASSGITNSATNSSTSTPITVTLSGTPSSDSLVMGAIQCDGDRTITPGTGFTEITQLLHDAGSDNLQVQFDAESADTTCDWSSVGSNSNSAAVLVLAPAVAPSVGGSKLVFCY